MFQDIEPYRIGGVSWYGTDPLKTKHYKDYPIYDGAILDRNNKPIAFRLQGKTTNEDQVIPIEDLVYTTEHRGMGFVRGLPKMINTLTDAKDVMEIDWYSLETLKADIIQPIIKETQEGMADLSDGNLIPAEAIQSTIDGGQLTPIQRTAVEQIRGAGYVYFTAGKNEKLTFPTSQRPHPNGEAHVLRVNRRMIDNLGLSYDLFDGKNLGGPSYRGMIKRVNKHLQSRHSTINRHVQGLLSFAIAHLMEIGYLPDNSNDTWWDWSLQPIGEFNIDEGNVRSANLEDYHNGILNLSDLASKNNQTVDELLDARDAINRDRATRVVEYMQWMKKTYDISLTYDQARSEYERPSGNMASVAQPEVQQEIPPSQPNE